MRRDFIADVSHELNTPITSILGFTATLRDGAADNIADRDRFLEIIHKQSNRLKAIVEDLLALSSIEDSTEKGEIELKEIPVGAAIQNAVQACQTAATEKNIQLEISCPENLKANINLSLLQQAIINLIHNAVKFSEPGIKIEIIAGQSDTEIAIQVRDQGPGIAPKHLSRLFERFYRVDDSRSRSLGGTGLGLAIVKHIVAAHKGRVAVESEEEKRSTFSIFLPKT
jgi:two-component system phosphate regulon sensor histidine kinase PhoR